MCGIIGAVAQRDIVPILLAGLKRLEYRGYDSAGMAVLNAAARIEHIRRVGKVMQLTTALQQSPLQGNTGIAHTRWATHGMPSEVNAHPHTSQNEIAIVHNGIIENYMELRQQLSEHGYLFTSETDTEVVVHLIHYYLQQHNLLAAVQTATTKLKGAYALGVIDCKQPQRLIAVRCGSPLIIGVGSGEHFIASDQVALLPVTQNFIFLEDGDLADLNQRGFSIYDIHGKKTTREMHQSRLSAQQIMKNGYRHFMLKEIYEQPQAIIDTLEHRILGEKIVMESFGNQGADIFTRLERIQIVACGTSYHAGMIAKYWLESLANIPSQVEIASEFRYRDNVVEDNQLFITLSQSGETADTLAALRKAKNSNYLATLAVCNVAESSLVRESDLYLATRAGAEIGVASTKAFTTQLNALLLLTAALVQQRKITLPFSLPNVLREIPQHVEKVLALNDIIVQLSETFANKYNTLFLGRGMQYPIALEGALKLKETSYIHAEAYPAGELKHGPLALIDEDMPVIAIAPNNALLGKLLSNLQEVKARGGKLIIFADQQLDLPIDKNVTIITMPEVNDIIAPIIYAVPLQLLAYHVAIIKGTDIDQPRNLAKSVTVE